MPRYITCSPYTSRGSMHYWWLTSSTLLWVSRMHNIDVYCFFISIVLHLSVSKSLHVSQIYIYIFIYIYTYIYIPLPRCVRTCFWALKKKNASKSAPNISPQNAPILSLKLQPSIEALAVARSQDWSDKPLGPNWFL